MFLSPQQNKMLSNITNILEKTSEFSSFNCTFDFCKQYILQSNTSNTIMVINNLCFAISVGTNLNKLVLINFILAIDCANFR